MKYLLLFLLNCSISFATDGKKSITSESTKKNDYYRLDYSNLRDTLYTLGDYFVEVNLTTQMAYLHSRNDSTKSFGVSTGNPKLFEAVETNSGVYAIQFKIERWHSIQFDSTLMLHFMTFNWGIGFHGLAGNSYYKYLGVKTSSHGCVRVSREDAKYVYSKVKVGTPVLVHKGDPAVTISFAEKNDDGLKHYSYQETKNIVERRLEQLYKGDYMLSAKEKLLIDNKSVTHAGLPAGNGAKIEKRQKLKPDYLYFELLTQIPKGYEFKVPDFKNLQIFEYSGNIPDINIILQETLD